MLGIGADWALKRVLKFVLKRLLGKALKGEVDLGQLDVALGAGTAELRDLELNSEYITEQLGAACPLELVEGFIGLTRAVLPTHALGTEGAVLEADNVELVLRLRRVATVDDAAATDQALTSGPHSPSGVAGAAGASLAPGVDAGMGDGVRIIATVVERLLSRLRLRATNVAVRLDPPANPLGRSSLSQPAIMLVRMTALEYADETAPPAEVVAAATTSRRVSFRGLAIELSDGRGGVHDDWETALAGAGEPGCGGEVLVRKDTGRGSTDVDVRLDPVQVYVSPRAVRRARNLCASARATRPPPAELTPGPALTMERERPLSGSMLLAQSLVEDLLPEWNTRWEPFDDDDDDDDVTKGGEGARVASGDDDGGGGLAAWIFGSPAIMALSSAGADGRGSGDGCNDASGDDVNEGDEDEFFDCNDTLIQSLSESLLGSSAHGAGGGGALWPWSPGMPRSGVDLDAEQEGARAGRRDLRVRLDAAYLAATLCYTDAPGSSGANVVEHLQLEVRCLTADIRRRDDCALVDARLELGAVSVSEWLLPESAPPSHAVLRELPPRDGLVLPPERTLGGLVWHPIALLSRGSGERATEVLISVTSGEHGHDVDVRLAPFLLWADVMLVTRFRALALATFADSNTTTNTKPPTGELRSAVERRAAVVGVLKLLLATAPATGRAGQAPLTTTATVTPQSVIVEAPVVRIVAPPLEPGVSGAAAAVLDVEAARACLRPSTSGSEARLSFQTAILAFIAGIGPVDTLLELSVDKDAGDGGTAVEIGIRWDLHPDLELQSSPSSSVPSDSLARDVHDAVQDRSEGGDLCDSELASLRSQAIQAALTTVTLDVPSLRATLTTALLRHLRTMVESALGGADPALAPPRSVPLAASLRLGTFEVKLNSSPWGDADAHNASCHASGLDLCHASALSGVEGADAVWLSVDTISAVEGDAVTLLSLDRMAAVAGIAPRRDECGKVRVRDAAIALHLSRAAVSLPMAQLWPSWLVGLAAELSGMDVPAPAPLAPVVCDVHARCDDLAAVYWPDGEDEGEYGDDGQGSLTSSFASLVGVPPRGRVPAVLTASSLSLAVACEGTGDDAGTMADARLANLTLSVLPADLAADVAGIPSLVDHGCDASALRAAGFARVAREVALGATYRARSSGASCLELHNTELQIDSHLDSTGVLVQVLRQACAQEQGQPQEDGRVEQEQPRKQEHEQSPLAAPPLSDKEEGVLAGVREDAFLLAGSRALPHRSRGPRSDICAGVAGGVGTDAPWLRRQPRDHGYVVSPARIVEDHFPGDERLPTVAPCRLVMAPPAPASSASDAVAHWYGCSKVDVREDYVARPTLQEAEAAAQRYAPKLPPAPPECPPAQMRVSLHDVRVVWCLHNTSRWAGADVHNNDCGCDEPQAARDGVASGVRLEVNGLSLQYDAFAPGGHYAWRVAASALDVNVVDVTPDAAWRNVLGYLADPTQPRESGTRAVSADLTAVRPDACLTLEEFRLRITLLPVRVQLDQRVVRFLTAFFASDGTEAPQGAAPSFGEGNGYGSGDGDTGGDGDTHALAFFQRVEVSAFDLRLDHMPRTVDIAALRTGKYTEVLNLVPWGGVTVELAPVTVSGVHGWGALGSAVAGEWLEDVAGNQAYKFVQGIAPVRSICTVGSGAAALLVQPVEQYRKDRRVLKGARRGVAAFLRAVGSEALNVSAQVAGGAQAALDHAGRYATPAGADAIAAPPSPVAPPANLQEGWSAAVERLVHGVETAASLTGAPLRAYREGELSAGSAARHALRSAPAAAVAQAAAVTAAAHHTLVGARNGLGQDTAKRT